MPQSLFQPKQEAYPTLLLERGGCDLGGAVVEFDKLHKVKRDCSRRHLVARGS